MSNLKTNTTNLYRTRTAVMNLCGGTLNTILSTKTKYPYIRPCTEVILLDLSGALNETHVSAVNIKGFDKGEVPDITVVEDDDGDDDEPANAKHSVWDDDEPDTWL